MSFLPDSCHCERSAVECGNLLEVEEDFFNGEITAVAIAPL